MATLANRFVPPLSPVSRPGATTLLLTAAVALGGACTADDGMENVLPTASASASESNTEGGTATDSETTAGEVTYPVAYRFDCIDIRGIGDAGPDVLQARLLDQTWNADIDAFKLNIVIEVFGVDAGGGSVDLGIRSGVGPDAATMCAEPETTSPMYAGSFTPDVNSFAPSGDDDTCVAMQSGEGFGDFTLELGATDVAYIYAEDDNTVTFNCTPDATPDAVPIRAIVANVSADSTQTRLAGTLVGCLVQAEAMALCSCLGSCPNNTGPGDVQSDGTCAGCPTGGVTLDQLLGNIEPSMRCSDLLGEPAFDLDIAFTANALPNTLAACG